MILGLYNLPLKRERNKNNEMSFGRIQSILDAQTYHMFSSVKWQTKLDSSQALSTRNRQFLPSYVCLCIHKNQKWMSYCWDDQERLNIICNKIRKNAHVELKATKGWFVDNPTSNPQYCSPLGIFVAPNAYLVVRGFFVPPNAPPDVHWEGIL